MGWFTKKKKKPALTRDRLMLMQRAFDSAKVDNIFSGWVGTADTADQELKTQLKTIRNRVRNLCQNSEYARKVLAMTKINVVGPPGF